MSNLHPDQFGKRRNVQAAMTVHWGLKDKITDSYSDHDWQVLDRSPDDMHYGDRDACFDHGAGHIAEKSSNPTLDVRVSYHDNPHRLCEDCFEGRPFLQDRGKR